MTEHPMRTAVAPQEAREDAMCDDDAERDAGREDDDREPERLLPVSAIAARQQRKTRARRRECRSESRFVEALKSKLPPVRRTSATTGKITEQESAFSRL